MIVLALDTCVGACSAAILAHDHVLAVVSEPMTRGHQERLGPAVRDLMAGAKLSFCTVDRIAVTVGPGSFTGLRVGLAFAKGLALALARPCIGVGTLEALAAGAGGEAFAAAVIDAGRGCVYVQAFSSGVSREAPQVLPVATAAAEIIALIGSRGITLVGPGAAVLADLIPGARRLDIAAPPPEWVARLAARAPTTPPHPLYLRAPDARPKATLIVRAVAAAAAASLAAVHSSAFEAPWDEAAITALLATPGMLAFAASAASAPNGFILLRLAADEAEILTLATRPAHRRRGVARALLEAATRAALEGGAKSLFLEVAADNAGAQALYAKAGFVAVGARRGYYDRPTGAADAVILRRELNR